MIFNSLFVGKTSLRFDTVTKEKRNTKKYLGMAKRKEK